MSVSLWLREAQGGNSSSFTKLYKRYSEKVSRRCKSIMKDVDGAEDAISRSWLIAYEKIGSCRGHFSSWLYAIATNSCLMELRVKKQDREKSERVLSYQKVERGQGEISDFITAKRGYKTIQEAIASLDGVKKEALMFKMEGMTYKEIAERTKSSVAATKSRIYRAREAVRESLLGVEGHSRTKQRGYQKTYRDKPEVREKEREYRQRPDVKKYQKEYHKRLEVKVVKREYEKRPEVKERRLENNREYRKRPEVREREKISRKEHRSSPEYKLKRRDYAKEYGQRPKTKERRKEYDKEYNGRDEVRERKREYEKRPEVKERRLEYNREYRKRPEVRERRNKRRRELRRRKREEGNG